ncbi:nucleotidyltransferase domain-containing protein [Candidatus Pacearchaeota archaeon]|nr:nucleotidyltransferase domain-containing protein [Candidatus Pacearchaeota archaeon]
MINPSILTETEQKVIEKKLNNKKLTKQDSFYLSVSIRPKLQQIEELSKKNILRRIEYVPKSRVIEKKIVNIVLDNIKSVKAIFLYGSAIQTNYLEYKDIDILIFLKRKLWKDKWEKISLIKNLEEKARLLGLKLDIQIIDEKTFKNVYSSNLSLIYQLKDSKIIYGSLCIPKKIELPKINIKMKLDWSELDTPHPSGEEIYNCIRNTWLIKLALAKIIDNFILSNYLIEELGRNLITALKENKASELEKKIAINYLNKINRETLNKINEAKWEKIVI